MGRRVRAVSRAAGLAARGALRVDTADCAPASMACFAAMNPFHVDTAWRIPVPGTDLFAFSVESVWQGLKIVEGRQDRAMFTGIPAKRPPQSERGPGYNYAASLFGYGDRILDLVAARLLIYLPTYLHLLEHLLPEATEAEILAASAAGHDIAFFDWDDNFDILDPRSSFSHSAILAAWFDARLDPLLAAAEAAAGEHGVRPVLPTGRYRRLHESKGY